MIPVIVCPGCGTLYSLEHVPARPYKECATCHWPFDPASAETKYFDTTAQMMQDVARKPAREAWRDDAVRAATPIGFLMDPPALVEPPTVSVTAPALPEEANGA